VGEQGSVVGGGSSSSGSNGVQGGEEAEKGSVK